MDKETIKKNWGKRFSKFFRKTKYFRNEFKIIQKDLASTLKISENTITQWKQGKLDIKLTSIYEVVTYIKEKYPDSSPMLLLFPDLLEDEIKRAANIEIKEYEKLQNINRELQVRNNKLENDITRIETKNKIISEDFENLRKVCRGASPNVKAYFERYLRTGLFLKFF